MIHNWAFQWKMNFNPDPVKQVPEIIFSQKKKLHPALVLHKFCYSINIPRAPRHHTRL